MKNRPPPHRLESKITPYKLNPHAQIDVQEPLKARSAEVAQTDTGHDPLALEVVRVMDEMLQPKDMLLFGSRCRGDWNDNSDIDALAIMDDGHPGTERYRETLRAGRARALELYGHAIGVDLAIYSLDQFQRMRMARTHMAWNVAREGISMRHGGENEYGNEYPEPEVPDNWPDIERRFLNAQRHLDDAEGMLEMGLSRESVGWQLQHSIENALKGFLAHMDHPEENPGRWDSWTRSHDVERLQDLVNGYEEGRSMLQNRDFSELTEYAVKFQYDGMEHYLDESEVYRTVSATVARFMEYSQENSGLELPRYQRGDPRPIQEEQGE